MSSVVCIDCGAEQTHRVCAECFVDQREAAVAWTRGQGSHGDRTADDADEARIRALPHDRYLPGY